MRGALFSFGMDTVLPGGALRYVDENGSSLWKCSICDKVFNSSSKFARHKRTHSGEKPFVCQVDACGLGFSRNDHLKRHMKSHNGIRPFACDYPRCTMRFLTNHHLKRHLNSHLAKKFICPVETCSKQFTKLHMLTEHSFQHTGILPFQCSMENCEKRFASKRLVSLHESRHNRQCLPQKEGMAKRIQAPHPVKCIDEECNQLFALKSNMIVHYETVHKKARAFQCEYEGCEESFGTKGTMLRHFKVHLKSFPENDDSVFLF